MVEETGRTPADVTVMGVGDQGVWALDDLLEDGISWVDYVSFHIEERPLRSKRVPTRLFRRGEWRSAMEIWASPLSGDEKEERIKSCPNVAKLERYTTENRLWNEFAFVFADLGEDEMAEMLGGVTGCGSAGGKGARGDHAPRFRSVPWGAGVSRHRDGDGAGRGTE